MSPRYTADRCPACGSHDVTPYAILIGAAEEYGYECDACLHVWAVMAYPDDEEDAGVAAAPPRGRESAA